MLSICIKRRRLVVPYDRGHAKTAVLDRLALAGRAAFPLKGVAGSCTFRDGLALGLARRENRSPSARSERMVRHYLSGESTDRLML